MVSMPSAERAAVGQQLQAAKGRWSRFWERRRSPHHQDRHRRVLGWLTTTPGEVGAPTARRRAEVDTAAAGGAAHPTRGGFFVAELETIVRRRRPRRLSELSDLWRSGRIASVRLVEWS